MTERQKNTLAKVAWTAAYVLMLAFIWGNSLVPADGSSAMSGGVLEAIQSALTALFGASPEWLTEHVVRKCAHFTEYFALGLVSTNLVRGYLGKKPGLAGKLWPQLLLVVPIPIIDETIQLFSDGRSGQLTDVLLDLAGSVLALLVF